jgi:hypothetical protein
LLLILGLLLNFGLEDRLKDNIRDWGLRL